MYKICSKLTIKTSERRFLLFLLLTFNVNWVHTAALNYEILESNSHSFAAATKFKRQSLSCRSDIRKITP